MPAFTTSIQHRTGSSSQIKLGMQSKKGKGSIKQTYKNDLKKCKNKRKMKTKGNNTKKGKVKIEKYKLLLKNNIQTNQNKGKKTRKNNITKNYSRNRKK